MTVRFTDSGDQRPSTAVVEEIARRESTTPTSLPERLYDTVDPQALDSLFAGRSSAGSVRFEFCGYHVTVAHDGTVTVEE